MHETHVKTVTNIPTHKSLYSAAAIKIHKITSGLTVLKKIVFKKKGNLLVKIEKKTEIAWKIVKIFWKTLKNTEIAILKNGICL